MIHPHREIVITGDGVDFRHLHDVGLRGFGRRAPRMGFKSADCLQSFKTLIKWIKMESISYNPRLH